MQEPGGPLSFSLVGVFVAWLGPVLGPYALIVFAAAAGSVLLLSSRKTDSPHPRWHGVKFVALGSVIALLLTGPMVWAVEKYTAVPANIALIPVAFVLGLARDRLITLTEKLLDAIAARASAFINSVATFLGGGQQP